MTEKQVQYLPFHAINQFMIPEYQRKVIQMVIANLGDLSENKSKTINNMIKRYVTVPGFRNSSLAPMMVKVKSAITAFEKYPDFTAQILSAWSELNNELRQKVYDLLKARGWEILPAEADRTKLPGFLTTWHKNENFDGINQAFTEMYPDYKESTTDDVSLMTVWLSDSLPIGEDEPENPVEDESSQ
jgi:hypothetical protein